MINRFSTKKISYTALIMFMFVFTMGARSFTALYESSGLISQFKYICCLITIFLGWLKYKRISVFERKRLFYIETKSILYMVSILFLISIVYGVYSMSFTSRTILELIYLALPAVFTYIIINTLNKEQLYCCMIVSMLIFFVGYLTSLGLSFSEIINGLRSTSYGTSYSVLESSVFAAPSVGMAMYFLYNRKNKIITLLSVLFVFMTFKRIAIIFVIVMYFIPKVIDVNKKVSKKTIVFFIALFFVSTLIYYQIMKPENIAYLRVNYGIDMYKLTMTRTYRFRLLYESNFVSSGLGSANAYMTQHFHVNLEMDLIRMLFEVGILGLITLIIGIFSVVRKRYSLYIVLYMILNLLLSHSLADSFGWIFTYITVASCQYYENNELKIIKIKGR